MLKSLLEQREYKSEVLIKMYSVGELIVYGSTGVCRVHAKGILDKEFGGEKGRTYYTLKPIYRNETIYAPVDTKVFIRRLISAEEADKLIDKIPKVEAEMYNSKRIQDLTDHYQSSLNSHQCEDLIELVLSIYAKKQYVENQKRKFGQIDERYMKKAEELLYGEFAAALGIDKDAVPEYIAGRINTAE